MSMLTVRKLDPQIKERLRVRAAHHGHSMEEEVRQILTAACGAPDEALNLADLALHLFADEGGVDLDLPPRRVGREPPRFD